MSYYDSSKNKYLSVPTKKHKYFTDTDEIETFDDQKINGYISYTSGVNSEFSINEDKSLKTD